MKKMLFILLAVGIVVSATACGNAQKATEAAKQSTTVAATATAPVTTEATQEETSQTEQPHTVEMQMEEQPQEEQNMTLQMTIGSTPVAVSWEDNEAVQALKELCDGQPLTIQMSMYGGFEQVGSIGTKPPPQAISCSIPAIRWSFSTAPTAGLTPVSDISRTKQTRNLHSFSQTEM